MADDEITSNSSSLQDSQSNSPSAQGDGHGPPKTDGEPAKNQNEGLIMRVFDDFGVALKTDAIRFHEGEWTYQGEPPVSCQACNGRLHVYRRPFTAYGKDMRWWGIVCPNCPALFTIDDFYSFNSKALRVWDNPELASKKVSAGSEPQENSLGAKNRKEENHLVIINFHRPVLGADPLDESEFTSDRHRVYASKLLQDFECTRLLDDDGVIRAEWPTADVKHLDWREESRQSSQTTDNSKDFQIKIAAIKEQFPNAYSTWTESDDADLRDAVGRGLSVHEMSQLFQRQPGGIRSRVAKLGLD